jgi:hypothetical protein
MTRDEAELKLEEYRTAANAAWDAGGSDNDANAAKACDRLDTLTEALIAALTAPAAGEDVELVHALEEAVKIDLLGGTTARPALTQTARDALLSRLRAVPQGWKLVPIEPTPEMLEAYVDACFRRGQAGVEGIKVGWPAACAAAPAPEKDQPK